MSGTRAGGLKAARKVKERYGSNFFVKMGRKGGKISRGGGFAADRKLASRAGKIGGKISKRGPLWS